MRRLLNMAPLISLLLATACSAPVATEPAAITPPAPAPEETKAVAQKTILGQLTGTIMLDDSNPMAGGKLVVFKKGSGPPPFPSRYLRPPDETADIKTDGTFNVTLPEGAYYLTAINKSTEDLIGPPVEGDYVYPGPMSLQQGHTIYSVNGGQTTSIGHVKAVRFSKDDVAAHDDITSISGFVYGPNGEPVAGAITFAFTSPNTVGKPLFISERTTDDGRFELRVDKGGRYFVKSRTHLRGGHPVEGELIGVHGRTRPEAITLETGEHVTDVAIHARAFVNYRKDPEKAKYKPEGARD